MSVWMRFGRALIMTFKDQGLVLFNSLVLPSIRTALHEFAGVNGKNPWISRDLWMGRSIDGAFEAGVNPGTAYAKFTIPKGLPLEGFRSLAIENEPHVLDGFDGVIPSGYGKGVKTLLYRDTVIVKIAGRSFPALMEYHFHDADVAGKHYDICIEKISPGIHKFEVNVPNGPVKGRYAFTPTTKGLVVVPMKDRGLVLDKPSYVLRPDTFLKDLSSDQVVEQKLDGSLANVLVREGRAYFRSHRPSGSTYYDKLPSLEFLSNNSRLVSCRLIFPFADLNNTVITGELVHPDGVPRVAGILNAMPHRSRQIQAIRGPVRFYAWEISRYKGRDVSKLSYGQRRLLLEAVISEAQKFNANWDMVVKCPEGMDPYEFYQKIIELPLPYGEGVIVKGKDDVQGERPWPKVKDRDYVDFEVIDIQEGTGKYSGSVGRFVVRNPGNGSIGEIGSFSITDQQRQWIWNHRRELIPGRISDGGYLPEIRSGGLGEQRVGSDGNNRLLKVDLLPVGEYPVAKCLVMEVTERGAPRAGVFVGFHEGKGSTEAALAMYSESLAGGDPDTASDIKYALKTSAGWKAQ